MHEKRKRYYGKLADLAEELNATRKDLGKLDAEYQEWEDLHAAYTHFMEQARTSKPLSYEEKRFTLRLFRVADGTGVVGSLGPTGIKYLLRYEVASG